MCTERNWGIVRHGVAALTFTLALAGTNVAGATAVSALTGDTTIPLANQTVAARHNVRTLDNSVVNERGSTARYSANLRSPLLSLCRLERCALGSSVLEETNSLARTSISALEPSMKWRSNSFSIAGSRVWSKLIIFTSTSINVRLPIN
jgi:hypothetical protein